MQAGEHKTIRARPMRIDRQALDADDRRGGLADDVAVFRATRLTAPQRAACPTGRQNRVPRHRDRPGGRKSWPAILARKRDPDLGVLRRCNDRLNPTDVGLSGRPHLDFELRAGRFPGRERSLQFGRRNRLAVQRDIARRGDVQHAPDHGRRHMARPEHGDRCGQKKTSKQALDGQRRWIGAIGIHSQWYACRTVSDRSRAAWHESRPQPGAVPGATIAVPHQRQGVVCVALDLQTAQQGFRIATMPPTRHQRGGKA